MMKPPPAPAPLPAIKAGLLYFLIVFAAGFVLGSVRTLVLAPRLGEVAAVLLELPLLLAIAWFTCRRLTAALAVSPDPRARIIMGELAFVLTILAEVVLGALLGRSVLDVFAGFATTAGLLGLAGQALFGVFPLLQALPRRS